MAQTARQIRATLEAAGIRPLKQYGQHFLVDANLMEKLVAAAGIRPEDVILEVGPGTGALTEKLLEYNSGVVAVEIDRGLQRLLAERFAGCPRLALIAGDVLDRKSAIRADVLDALGAQRARLGGRILLVANLPYSIATPLVVNLLTGDLLVSPMCFTVQAEVGERFMAPAGSKAYGPASVIVQALATVKRIADVPPQAFWPAPKVHSIMLRLDARPDAPGPAVRARLSELVKACFGHRRKTMRSSLRAWLGEEAVQQLEREGRWKLADRPERWPVQEWVALAQRLL